MNEKMNRLALSNQSKIDGLKSELEKSSRKHLDKEKEVELLKMGLKERQVRFNEEVERTKKTITKSDISMNRGSRDSSWKMKGYNNS